MVSFFHSCSKLAYFFRTYYHLGFPPPVCAIVGYTRLAWEAITQLQTIAESAGQQVLSPRMRYLQLFLRIYSFLAAHP